MARVVLTEEARTDLNELIRSHSLPADTVKRLRRSMTRSSARSEMPANADTATLASGDRRALETYRALGVEVQLIG